MGLQGSDWRSLLRTPWAVLAVWVIYSLARLAIQPLLGWDPPGPDEWMRLLQVRALLDGQSWWDVTQYRINPPEGFSMHWSRLVDLPLAALIALVGETAAVALVPLVWLLPALLALRAIMLRLEFADLPFGFGLILLPAFPLLPGVFAPLSIDHHGPQAVLALVCAALLIQGSRWSAMACGLVAATWVVISLEGLPLVAVLAGLFGLRYLIDPQQRLLPWFLGALTVGGGALSMVTRAFEPGYCDVLLPGHVLTFAAATLVAATLVAVLLPWLPVQRDWRARLAALGLLPFLCLPLAVSTLGPCLVNPMAELDPLVQQYWHGYITEGLPLWKQPVSTGLMLVWTMAIILAGGWTMWRQQGRLHTASLLLFLYALAAAGYSLLVMREGVVAQLLAIPFAAVLLAHWLPRARGILAPVPRIAATLTAIGLATPMFASALAKPLDRHFPMATMRPQVAALTQRGACDYSRLAALPPGLVLAPLDAGPEILGRTNHTIVAASYHRNQRPMRDVMAVLTGPVDAAQAMVADYRPDYVVVCAAEGDVALYRTAAPGNFANALVSGEAGGWLATDEAVSQEPLKVFRVVRPELRPDETPAPLR